MKCEEIQSALIEDDGEEMESSRREEIEHHLLTCGKCAQDAKEVKMLLQLMEGSPMAVPGAALKDNFAYMLRSESEKLAAAGLLKEDSPFRGRPPGRVMRLASWWKIAAIFLILVLGIWIGTRLPVSSSRSEITGLKKEVKDMKETLLFALLKEESASQRIRAVSYTEDISNPDVSIINALVSTLNHDKNVNVRLASLYSLARFPNNASVRDSLVRSLGMQTEPIVQIVLINMLTEMKEERAIQPIRDILSDEKTLPDVKTIAEKGLRIL